MVDPNISNEHVDKCIEENFAVWLKDYVSLYSKIDLHRLYILKIFLITQFMSNDFVQVDNPSNKVLDQNIHALAWGPLRIVKTWPIYFVNGFKFHTKEHSIGKSTINCGVCVKGTGYGEYENDFYGQLEEIVQIEYPGLPLKMVMLFKCEWFDPTIGRGKKVDETHGIIQIRHNRHYGKYDPFIIAQKAIQVYFAPHPIRTRSNADWWFVIKTKARGVIEDSNSAYQEDFIDQNCDLNSADLDSTIILQDVDETFEEVDELDDDDCELINEDGDCELINEDGEIRDSDEEEDKEIDDVLDEDEDFSDHSDN
jgi:hypothetical protein